MSIKKIECLVDISGVTPVTEQFAGTQGDHRVTEIEFTLTDELYAAATNESNSKITYHFDVYDGEGGIWQSEVKPLEQNIGLMLEERHTRHGGKITVYLVITALSQDNQTEMELYSFPCVLRLKSRPDGIYQDDENLESVASLAESTKFNAETAVSAAASAQSAESSARQLAAEVQEKLANGEFDGQDGVSVTHSFDGTVLTLTSASGTSSVDLKGEKGDIGEQGPKGDAGKDAVTDQTYNSESENAQSGKAVAEALQNYVPTQDSNQMTWEVYALNPGTPTTKLEVEENDLFENHGRYGQIPYRQNNGNLLTNAPVKELDCANKKYVDDAVKSIDIGEVNVDISGKVDKIPSKQRQTLEGVNGQIGVYATNDYSVGNPFLAQVHYNWEPYTIPYRLASGQIHVGLSGYDEIEGASKIFQDAAVPKSYLTMVRTLLENSIANATNIANTAQQTADSKKLTSFYTSAKTTLDYNSLYILWSNSGDADIELYNSETGARVADTAGEQLPAAKVVCLFLPTSSTEITSAGVSKAVSKRCLYLGVKGTPSILNMNVTSKQFVVDSGNINFTPATAVSVFKMAL